VLYTQAPTSFFWDICLATVDDYRAAEAVAHEVLQPLFFNRAPTTLRLDETRAVDNFAIIADSYSGIQSAQSQSIGVMAALFRRALLCKNINEFDPISSTWSPHPPPVALLWASSNSCAGGAYMLLTSFAQHLCLE